MAPPGAWAEPLPGKSPEKSSGEPGTVLCYCAYRLTPFGPAARSACRQRGRLFRFQSSGDARALPERQDSMLFMAIGNTSFEWRQNGTRGVLPCESGDPC
jgi:hypothetical protein